MRKQDWAERLSRFTLGRMQTPHEWGVHDCAIFAADAVLEMTGEDPMQDLRGSYDSPVSAARVVRQAGFESLGDMIADRFEECPPAMVRRGDLILADGEMGEFIAVVTGHTAVGPAAFGLSHVPITEARRAYRVD